MQTASLTLHRQFFPVAGRPLWTLARKSLHNQFRPKTRLKPSEWADRYRVLSRENCAEPGQWRTARTPYLREIMDAVFDFRVWMVVLMKAAQLGFTEVVNNLVGYYIHQDPSPILVVQPNVEPMAHAWSKGRLAPMLRDTDALRGRVKDARMRDAGNTVGHKQFPGGEISIAGANSAAGLRSRPIRILLLDEVDGYPPSASEEGDPVELAIVRTDTFWNRKVVLGSTPTDKGISRIEKAHTASDQRQYFVPCPHCGYQQQLIWKQLQWEKDNPQTAMYQCGHISPDGELLGGCGKMIPERFKPSMLRAGEWRAQTDFNGIAGFHLNGLYSPFRTWSELAALWLDIHDDRERLKTFINTRLGQVWEDYGEVASASELEKRAEFYAAEVPAGVGVLTAGVDVQDDRLELAVKGWGERYESWLIAHHRIHGDPESDETWARLEAVLVKPYRHETGADMRIQCCMIDSGYKTANVYEFVRPRERRNVFASKGLDERAKAPLSRASRANRAGVKLFAIGVVALKDTLFGRLRVDQPGPGYLHFCQPGNGGADAEYFAQFGAEKRVTQKVRGQGRPIRKYIQIRTRNEAIDLEVLALAALHALGPGVMDNLGTLARRMTAKGEALKQKESVPTPSKESKRREKSWLNRWRDE
jgi:phage terminase large subunit GpA-like protein